MKIVPYLEEKDYLRFGRAEEIKDPQARRVFRFLEMVPGGLSWFTLFLLVWVSWLFPFFAAIFIIVFDFYWLIKTVYLSLHLRSSYQTMRKNLTVDWQKKLQALPREQYVYRGIADWQELYHLVIFPMYTESHLVVRSSFEALLKTKYPKDKFIVVLATEEKGGAEADDVAEKIRQEFGEAFYKFLVTKHPADVFGEIAGKGSNESFAARKAKEAIIDPLGIPYDRILVSVFDVDTNVPEQYFGVLTHSFVRQADATRVSYQPVPFFTNNIWEAPAIARVIAFSATFWHMMQQERPERQTTFSSHSMSFQALVEIGYWQTNIVSEDSRIFWQCYFHYKGNWRTQSLFYPVMMDANVAHSFMRTMINVYKQQRRWGYGSENLPYIMYAFSKEKSIKRSTKFKWIFNVIEGFHSWATNSLIIFFLGWLPLYIGGESFNSDLISYNLPRFTRNLMILAMLGLVSSAVMSILLLPPRPPQYGRWRYLLMVLQWPLMLVTIIFFGSFPGLEAQTRLMLGKYMGFWVTEKARKTDAGTVV
jgi:hypothetical protein